MASDASVLFKDAATLWIESVQVRLQPRTLEDYRNEVETLSAHFGQKQLREITIDAVLEFQRMRAEHAPGRVNKEIGRLGQILAMADLWEPIKRHYRPLPQRPTPGVALTREQAKHLFEVGSRKKRWQVALWTAIISANTTAGPGELRRLRLRDVDLEHKTIRINDGLKNQYRARTVELNQAALQATEHLMQRAKMLGANLPEHYLIPARSRVNTGKKHAEVRFDLTRPANSWNTAWNQMRKAAGLPRLRIYDCRHSAVTWLAADPNVSLQTVAEIAGWNSTQMLRRYSHQSSSTRRAALESLDAPEKPKNGNANGYALPIDIDADQLKSALLVLLQTGIKFLQQNGLGGGQ